jgi:Ca-activated chloride channel family protein
MILLCLLLAAGDTERVVVVAKHQQPGMFEKLTNGVSRAIHRLYEKGDEKVDEGNALAAEGRPDAALHEYDEAHQRLPDSPELAYDRSTALSKMDPAKAPEAASEALQALQHGDAQLKSKAAYQLGISQEAMGKPEEAMKSYGLSLGLDPDDEDAKVNLELLLKTEERKQKQPQQQQDKEKKNQQEKKDQQQQSKGGEDKDKKDQSPKGKDDQKQQEAQQKPDNEQKPDEKKQAQAQAEEKPVDRSEAERLLDALRASEKNLQTWRFAKDKRNNARRSESEKDW